MMRALGSAVVLSGLATVSNYLLLAWLARSSEPLAFSTYLYNVALAAILGTVVLYSTQRVFTATVLEGVPPQVCFNRLLGLKLTLGVTLCASILLIGLALGSTIIFVPLLLIYPMLNLGFLFEHYANNTMLAAITLADKLIFFALVVLASMFEGVSSWIYFAFAIASLVSLGCQYFKFRQYVVNFRLVSLQEISEVARKFLSLVLIDLVQLTYGHYSRLIIEYKKGLLEFAAVSVAFQIIKVASIFQSQVEYFFRPWIVSAVIEKDVGNLVRIAMKYLVMTTLPTMAGSIILFVFAEDIITIAFGDGFQQAGSALRILSVLPILVNLMRFSETVFIGLGKNSIPLACNVLASAALILTLFMIPASLGNSVFLIAIIITQLVYLLAITVCGVYIIYTPKSNSGNKLEEGC